MNVWWLFKKLLSQYYIPMHKSGEEQFFGVINKYMIAPLCKYVNHFWARKATQLLACLLFWGFYENRSELLGKLRTSLEKK